MIETKWSTLTEKDFQEMNVHFPVHKYRKGKTGKLIFSEVQGI
jgi:hypothetical protein